jgi:predicted transposase YdaD
MPLFDEPPLHDFPDRAIRRLLENPGNLRDLIAAVVPDLVDRFDFDRLEILPRAFLLDDWRRRESDMLFRLPFRDDEAAPPVLVCLLIEHQSEADPVMPLRVLIYAMLYWQEEWRAWEAVRPRREALRLSPILPVVFHTGSGTWQTNRELVELIVGPEALRAFAPRWQPLFWDLADRTPEELLQAAGEWLAALAVVRAEREDEDSFREVFAAVLRRLEALSDPERMRWHDLLWFILSWALRRRPGRERGELLATARDSQSEVAHREEVEKMSETIEQTWEQELLARGAAQGKVEGQLIACKENLRVLLEERFGALPPEVAERIEGTADLDRLRSAVRQVVHLAALSELDL